MRAFDRRVLAAVRDLGANAYGVTIMKALAPPMPEAARRSTFRFLLHVLKGPGLGAVYVSLERLEEQGLVSSYLGEPCAERDGRRKRHYCITDLAEQALLET